VDAARQCAFFDPAAFLVDTGVAYLRLTQDYPAAGFADSVFLAVWCDGRDNGDIYGARITPSGEVLDTSGLRIRATVNWQEAPAIAARGSCFFVVWTDRPPGSTHRDLHAGRVTVGGEILDTAGIVINHVDDHQDQPAVAAGESCYLVVWYDRRGATPGDVYGARVSFSGEVLDPTGIPLGVGLGVESYPDVACAGHDFLVVWQSTSSGASSVWGTRVSSAGRVLRPGCFPIAGDASRGEQAGRPVVSSDGTEFLVAWQNTGAARGIYARRISAAGEPLGEVFPLSHAQSDQQAPSVCLVGSNYVVAWQDYRSGTWDVYGARVSRAGAVLDTADLLLASAVNDQMVPALAAGQDRLLAVWSDRRLDPNRSSVFMAMLDTAARTVGTITPPAFTEYYAVQRVPAVAASDEGYLVLWESDGPGSSGWNTDVCGTRLAPSGQVLGPHATGVALRARDELAPAVAAGESCYLVVYESDRIYGARVSSSGDVLDPLGFAITIGDAGAEPDVARGASGFLAAWTRGSSQTGVYGARVSEAGRLLDSAKILIEGSTGTARRPAVTFGDSWYLVVWDHGTAIAGAFINQGGRVVARCPQISRTTRAAYTDCAFDGTNFLVVWADWDWERIWGARVSQTGQVLDTAAVQMSWGSYYDYPQLPAVAFDGTNYVVAWQSGYTREASIKGSIVTPSMVRTDSFDVTTPLAGLTAPALCRGRDGRVLLTFSGPAQGIGGCDTLKRIWAAFVGLPVGTAECPAAGRTLWGLSAWPNPFRSRVTFAVPSNVDQQAVSIRDAAGRHVRTIAAPDGARLTWDGRDATGVPLPPGVYFCELASKRSKTSVRLVRVE